MKLKIFAPVLAAAVLAAGLFIAKAQSADRPLGFGGRGPILERIAKKLQLTDTQKTQIKAVLVAEKEPLTSILTRWHDARIQLREAIHAEGATEATVRSAAAQVAAVEADFAVERLKLHNEIAPLLTAEQKQKIIAMEQKLDEFLDGIIAKIGAGLTTKS